MANEYRITINNTNATDGVNNRLTVNDVGVDTFDEAGALTLEADPHCLAIVWRHSATRAELQRALHVAYLKVIDHLAGR